MRERKKVKNGWSKKAKRRLDDFVGKFLLNNT